MFVDNLIVFVLTSFGRFGAERPNERAAPARYCAKHNTTPVIAITCVILNRQDGRDARTLFEFGGRDETTAARYFHCERISPSPDDRRFSIMRSGREQLQNSQRRSPRTRPERHVESRRSYIVFVSLSVITTRVNDFRLLVAVRRNAVGS